MTIAYTSGGSVLARLALVLGALTLGGCIADDVPECARLCVESVAWHRMASGWEVATLAYPAAAREVMVNDGWVVWTEGLPELAASRLIALNRTTNELRIWNSPLNGHPLFLPYYALDGSTVRFTVARLGASRDEVQSTEIIQWDLPSGQVSRILHTYNQRPVLESVDWPWALVSTDHNAAVLVNISANSVVPIASEMSGSRMMLHNGFLLAIVREADGSYVRIQDLANGAATSEILDSGPDLELAIQVGDGIMRVTLAHLEYRRGNGQHFAIDLNGADSGRVHISVDKPVAAWQGPGRLLYADLAAASSVVVLEGEFRPGMDIHGDCIFFSQLIDTRHGPQMALRMVRPNSGVPC